jgi:hypothetical protein
MYSSAPRDDVELERRGLERHIPQKTSASNINLDRHLETVTKPPPSAKKGSKNSRAQNVVKFVQSHQSSSYASKRKVFIHRSSGQGNELIEERRNAQRDVKKRNSTDRRKHLSLSLSLSRSHAHTVGSDTGPMCAAN